jgi:hypothetical protein
VLSVQATGRVNSSSGHGIIPAVPACRNGPPSGPALASAALPAASYRRLQGIKARYDPDQVIISTHPVRPADFAA